LSASITSTGSTRSVTKKTAVLYKVKLLSLAQLASASETSRGSGKKFIKRFRLMKQKLFKISIKFIA
jgi:hypothetical protein